MNFTRLKIYKCDNYFIDKASYIPKNNIQVTERNP